MDWIGIGAVIVGIFLVVIGLGLVFNLPAITQFVEAIFGVLCIILGLIGVFFGAKLLRSV